MLQKRQSWPVWQRQEEQCHSDRAVVSLSQTRHFESPYLVYHEKIKTSRVFIRDCSMVSVYPLVLLGGGQVHMQLLKGDFVISLDDGWIRFVAASHQVRRRRRGHPGRAAELSSS